MKKLLNIIFCLCILFVSVNFAQNQPAEKAKSEDYSNEKINETELSDDEDLSEEEDKNNACQLPANVTALELSQTKINLNCQASDKSCSNNKIIEVKTTAPDREDIEVKYVYIVSAGKIIGEGAIVKWDLSDVKPGSYTITAGISQPFPDSTTWKVFGATQTRVVVIKE